MNIGKVSVEPGGGTIEQTNKSPLIIYPSPTLTSTKVVNCVSDTKSPLMTMVPGLIPPIFAPGGNESLPPTALIGAPPIKIVLASKTPFSAYIAENRFSVLPSLIFLPGSGIISRPSLNAFNVALAQIS